MTTIPEVDVGDRVRIYTTSGFTASGVSFDPDIVEILVRVPSGTVTTYTYLVDSEVLRTAEGVYEMELDVEVSGIYRYRIQGYATTGENQGAEEGVFKAVPQRVS